VMVAVSTVDTFSVTVCLVTGKCANDDVENNKRNVSNKNLFIMFNFGLTKNKLNKMKKIIVILLLVPFFGFAQYSKKQLRKIKKLELKVVNKGLDLKETFVVYHKTFSSYENDWESALFSAGLDVGDYFDKKNVKDTNNREMILYDEVIFRGRYVFDISPYTRITIKDLKNDNKIVALIEHNGWSGWGEESIYLMDYIVNALIESN